MKDPKLEYRPFEDKPSVKALILSSVLFWAVIAMVFIL